jgi:uncharacterized protein (TIGR03790 family)
MPAVCRALEPHEILVIANANAAHSVELAEYYMGKRSIPQKNLLILRLTVKERCSREEYDGNVVPVVRKYIREKDPNRTIRCLVTLHGLPLKVDPPLIAVAEKKQVKALRKKQKALKERLKTLGDKKEKDTSDLKNELKDIKKQIGVLTKSDQRSSFDSELALVLAGDYSRAGWITNPYFIGFKSQKLPISRHKVLLVSRLDAPTEDIVRRIIDDSIKTERTGLSGTAYFDARWPLPAKNPPPKNKMGYRFYDRSIHLAAGRVRKSKRMPVKIDEKSELFQPGEAPDAALYCGWYSLARYVDAFKWRPGSVAYHIASAECRTLKKKDSRVWCKRMLEEGVAATVGPVNEPYLQAFPVPELFFALLLEGRLTLAEVYAFSKPFWSWQMVLIGDPLYRPFKRE